MTHDELLAEINEVGYCLENGHTLLRTEIADQIKALRAVVELHKPSNEWRQIDTKLPNCHGCVTEQYPCPTIQAIENELK